MIYALVFLMSVIFTAQSLNARLFSDAYEGPVKDDSSIVYGIIYGLVIAFLTFCVNGFSFHPSTLTVIYGLITGIVLTVYTNSLVAGSRLGSYNFMMLSQLSGGILIPMVYNALFMGERLQGIRIGGIAIVLCCVVLMNWGGLTINGRKPTVGYFIACLLLFISNGLYAQLLNLQQAYVGAGERCDMVIVTYASSAVFALLVGGIKKKKELPTAFKMGKRALIFALAACCCSTAATNLLMYLILKVSSVTVFYAVNDVAVLVLSALLAFILFKEKLKWNQLTAVVLSVVGIFMLTI